MSIQLFPTNFPPPNTPVVDTQGAMSIPGMAFFRALWNRTGQLTGSPYATADTLSSTGTTQADALALTSDWNNITTVAAGSGVILPSLTQGQIVWVFNNDPAQNLNVYPPLGASITYQSVTTGVNSPVSLAFASLLAAFYFSNTSIVAA
jgi:hypothetical protein